jgi:CDP-glucose 4,6-dehydratase
MEINPTFWSKKKVLITGHTGFKGSWLTLWLKSLGSDVVGYSLDPPTKPSLFNMAQVSRKMISLTDDICDLETLRSTIDQYQPQIVIHMAAQSLVMDSYKNPVKTYATNVMGTVNILEATLNSKSVKVLINVTSDKCYENKEQGQGYQEDARMGGRDPYSSSKGCAELITNAYRSSFFSKSDSFREVFIASARAGNVIGGGDWANHRLVPDIMRKFMAGDPAFIRNPSYTRPWQHVLDPLNGYLLLAEKLWDEGAQFSEGWNFGPDEAGSQTVSWVADRLKDLWGEDAQWLSDSSSQPHEAKVLRLDCSKAKKHLKWKPKLNLDMALDWTNDWYKAYQKKQDMQEFTYNQISSYQNMEPI